LIRQEGTDPALLQWFDVAYIACSATIVSFWYCPNKLMDYMMASRPVFEGN
jgi:hypothetical protein